MNPNKKTPTKLISNIPEERRENCRWDITLSFWKASLDMHEFNSQHKCHGPIVAPRWAYISRSLSEIIFLLENRLAWGIFVVLVWFGFFLYFPQKLFPSYYVLLQKLKKRKITKNPNPKYTSEKLLRVPALD